MSLIICSGRDPSMITVFQCLLFRWYPGSTAACAPRSPSASWGSHLRLTRSESAPSWDRANIFPATLNTEVSGPNGNVSSAPANERQCSRSSAAFIARTLPDRAAGLSTAITGERLEQPEVRIAVVLVRPPRQRAVALRCDRLPRVAHRAVHRHRVAPRLRVLRRQRQAEQAAVEHGGELPRGQVVHGPGGTDEVRHPPVEERLGETGRGP